jgi:hypothetical protein
MIHYTLTRSKRKTVAVYIRGDCVDVRAPLKMPKRDINRFVASKEKWINDKLVLFRKRSKRREVFSLNYGSIITLRGSEYIITSSYKTRKGFDGEAYYLPPGFEPEQIKQTCIQTYRRLAWAHLVGRAAVYADRMGAAPASVKVSDAKKRWGSCSSKRSVNLSWRLMMADDSVIDYVVVHEHAHLYKMNHSPRFWTVVGSVLPDYREQKRKLKLFLERLAGEDWD